MLYTLLGIIITLQLFIMRQFHERVVKLEDRMERFQDVLSKWRALIYDRIERSTGSDETLRLLQYFPDAARREVFGDRARLRRHKE